MDINPDDLPMPTTLAVSESIVWKGHTEDSLSFPRYTGGSSQIVRFDGGSQWFEFKRVECPKAILSAE